jgi:hypothetical protein
MRAIYSLHPDNIDCIPNLSWISSKLREMPSSNAPFFSLPPWHVLTYGSLLGSNLFQTFLNGPISYTALPRPQFSTLQTAIFPAYFSLQTALPVLLALTWPGEKVLGIGNAVARRAEGVQGLMKSEEGNFWTALVPMAVMFGTSAINLLALGPMTTKVMKQRKHQGKVSHACDSRPLD